VRAYALVEVGDDQAVDVWVPKTEINAKSLTNRVLGDLACFDNDPVAQVGDSGGAPNVVSGHARGECEALAVHG
jgi:hypothetical protein